MQIVRICNPCCTDYVAVLNRGLEGSVNLTHTNLKSRAPREVQIAFLAQSGNTPKLLERLGSNSQYQSFSPDQVRG